MGFIKWLGRLVGSDTQPNQEEELELKDQLTIKHKPSATLNEIDQSRGFLELTPKPSTYSLTRSAEDLPIDQSHEQLQAKVELDDGTHEEMKSANLESASPKSASPESASPESASPELNRSLVIKPKIIKDLGHQTSSSTIPCFDPMQALQRVAKVELVNSGGNTQLASDSELTDPVLTREVDLTESLSVVDEPIVLYHGNKKSLCVVKDLGSSSFSHQGLAKVVTEIGLRSFNEFYNDLRNMDIPLYRDQLVSVISPFRLRLPQVWELQALYSSEELSADTVYWTRDSRQHLWSPTEGKWRSVSQNLKAKLVLFFNDDHWSIDALSYEEYTEIDALASLESLASQAMKSFDFGLTDLGVFEEASVNEPIGDAYATFELAPKAESQDKSVGNKEEQERFSAVVDFQLEAKTEVSTEAAHTEAAPTEATAVPPDFGQYSEEQQALFKLIPHEYISYILALDKDESLSQILMIIHNEKKILNRDLMEKYGINSIKVSLSINKLERTLKENQLKSLVANRFETTRTAPQTGTYLTWVLPAHD